MKKEEKTELEMTNKDLQKLVCEVCGESNVIMCKRVWYNANTEEIVDDFSNDWEDTYCEDCEENTPLITLEEYLAIN